ncbi:MAG: hypothetical protein D6798_14230 [Deltaproteobacteria bacterium]|nr:MAG: hypothetical protein D6798_14230 [Deltaproteobacteria bacterium]
MASWSPHPRPVEESHPRPGLRRRRVMRALTTFDDFRELLADPVRMSAFRRAVFETVGEGDVVVDLGAGTGILGFWALQAGARRVHRIEKSEAIELARQVAAHNGWLDRVVLHAAVSTEVELEPADVLLSETLGAWAVDENTLPFTIDARRRLLRSGGRMVALCARMAKRTPQDAEPDPPA